MRPYCVAKAGLVGAGIVRHLSDGEELRSLLPADSCWIDVLGPMLEARRGGLICLSLCFGMWLLALELWPEVHRVDHDRVVTVAVQDPDLKQDPGCGGADHHDEIIVVGCCAVHLVAYRMENVFVRDPVPSSDIRDPH